MTSSRVTDSSLLVYGAYGYTGRLVTEAAVARGLRVVVGGRDPARLRTVAEHHGLESRVFALDDPALVRGSLEGISAVAHCAGPFRATALPMVRAAIAAGCHYLDVTGEIAVFERILGSSGEAAAAAERGVTLVPGCGFDVVPTDCLAAMLHDELPSANRLELALVAGGGASPGTARTTLAGLDEGGQARIDGRLRRVPLGWRRRVVEFPSGSRRVVTIPWGDLSTAYHSTGIPNILTYARMPVLGAPGRLPQELAARLLRLSWAKQLASSAIERSFPGPGRQQRAASHCELWARVSAPSGRSATATLITPNAYDLTADAVVTAATRLTGGGVAAGALTPSTAFGADFVCQLERVKLFGPHVD